MQDDECKAFLAFHSLVLLLLIPTVRSDLLDLVLSSTRKRAQTQKIPFSLKQLQLNSMTDTGSKAAVKEEMMGLEEDAKVEESTKRQSSKELHNDTAKKQKRELDTDDDSVRWLQEYSITPCYFLLVIHVS
jgi:hypothetical protein